jgi:hypothetical protein
LFNHNIARAAAVISRSGDVIPCASTCEVISATAIAVADV